MAVVIRSPEVADKARVLSNKSLDNEQTSTLIDENAVPEEQEIQTDQESNTDAISADTPTRVVSSEEVEQVYGQYKTDHEYDENNVDHINEEIERYRIEIDGLKKKLHALEDSIEEEKSTAIKQGFDKGYEEGDAAARENFDEKSQQLQAIIKGFDESRDGVLESQEDAMVEIVTAALIKILGEKYVTQEGTIAAVRSAMQHVAQRDQLLFRVSPEDYELLNHNKSDLFAGLDHSKTELVPDEKVKLGGCILENKAGSIDKRLEVQLQTFTDTLIRVRNQRLAREL